MDIGTEGFASWGEDRNQQSQQNSAGFQGRPLRAVQDSMVVGEASFLAQPHDAQAGGHSSFARRQDRSNQQDFGVLPNRLGEQRRKLYNQGQQFGRQCQQLKTSRGKSGLQLTQSADSFSKIKMAKVELRGRGGSDVALLPEKEG
jgi:hypothetical protein